MDPGLTPGACRPRKRPSDARSAVRKRSYLGTMRPEDLLVPDAGRPVLPARRLLHRPAAAGRAGADHARPFRPCPAGHGAVLATPRRSTSCGCATARISPARRRPSRYGETVDARRRRRVTFHPAGHVLGSAQICVECERPAHRRRRATTRTCADPTCAPFELDPLRRVHHRGDVRPAGVPPWRRRRARSPSSCTRSRCFPSARISSAPIRSARRSA